tara:strand:+ start:920 stop:1783 length:864 start_codon:yes stop_codon:yes gene_type:complete
MNKSLYPAFIILLIIFISCSKKDNSPKPNKKDAPKIETKITENDSAEVMIEINENKPEENVIKEINEELTTINTDSLIQTNDTQFYKLEKSIEDILLKISFLEKQLLLNENSAPSTSFTEKLKNLIDAPPIKHQISLKNESIIEGFIEKDNETNILVMTSLGRLTIDKNEIEYIEEITTLEPDIIFIGHGLEKEFDTYYEFTGKVLNQGTLRGDFVRVIYKLWADDTNMLFSDSAFVEGDQIKYQSGIVTDTALNPNKSARYTVKVPINHTAPVTYVTREIRWMKYN